MLNLKPYLATAALAGVLSIALAACGASANVNAQAGEANADGSGSNPNATGEERPVTNDFPFPARDAALAEASGEAVAVFAGGCFWCTEAVFKRVDGVSKVVSGYAGGCADTANYRQVAAGGTKHAEAIEITYDPSKITYGELLRVFFYTHDPTTLNRQGPDRGTQYRSAVFYGSEDEKAITQAYIDQLNEASAFNNPIVTTLEPLEAFYEAEDYHQDFAARNPSHPYVKAWVPAKFEKLETLQKSTP